MANKRMIEKHCLNCKNKTKHLFLNIHKSKCEECSRITVTRDRREESQ